MMMVTYETQINVAQLQEVRLLLRHIKNGAAKALTIGANKAGPKIRTLSSLKVREQIRLKVAYVNKHLTFQRATRDRPTARIKTESRGILLSRFSTDNLIADAEKTSWIRPPQIPESGIRVKIKPSGASKILSSPPGSASKPFFLILRHSGRVGIAVRREGLGPRGGRLNVLHGPSLSQVYSDVRDEVMSVAGVEYVNEVKNAALYLVRKQEPR